MCVMCVMCDDVNDVNDGGVNENDSDCFKIKYKNINKNINKNIEEKKKKPVGEMAIQCH